MAGTLLIMMLVVVCALAVAALAVAGAAPEFADRYPRTARVVTTVARHLNGEGEAPKHVGRLFRA